MKVKIDTARIKPYHHRSDKYANGYRHYFISHTGHEVPCVTKEGAKIALRHDTEAEMIAIKESKAANGFNYQEENYASE